MILSVIDGEWLNTMASYQLDKYIQHLLDSCSFSSFRVPSIFTVWCPCAHVSDCECVYKSFNLFEEWLYVTCVLLVSSLFLWTEYRVIQHSVEYLIKMRYVFFSSLFFLCVHFWMHVMHQFVFLSFSHCFCLWFKFYHRLLRSQLQQFSKCHVFCGWATFVIYLDKLTSFTYIDCCRFQFVSTIFISFIPDSELAAGTGYCN